MSEIERILESFEDDLRYKMASDNIGDSELWFFVMESGAFTMRNLAAFLLEFKTVLSDTVCIVKDGENKETLNFELKSLGLEDSGLEVLTEEETLTFGFANRSVLISNTRIYNDLDIPDRQISVLELINPLPDYLLLLGEDISMFGGLGPVKEIFYDIASRRDINLINLLNLDDRLLETVYGRDILTEHLYGELCRGVFPEKDLRDLKDDLTTRELKSAVSLLKQFVRSYEELRAYDIGTDKKFTARYMVFSVLLEVFTKNLTADDIVGILDRFHDYLENRRIISFDREAQRRFIFFDSLEPEEFVKKYWAKGYEDEVRHVIDHLMHCRIRDELTAEKIRYSEFERKAGGEMLNLINRNMDFYPNLTNFSNFENFLKDLYKNRDVLKVLKDEEL